jgi:O-acetyl-ADP-ribose deacetylase (regulator of RNase III)
MKRQLHRATFEIVLGDLTEREEDAIVNPANPNLMMKSGVAALIRQKGGRLIQIECNRKAPVPVGDAVITTGGELMALHVIHAVGPKWGEGNEDEKLRSTIYRTLRVADQNGLRSLAMPAISTGASGFPPRRAAEIILDTTIRYLNVQSSLTRVAIVLSDATMRDLFVEVAEGMEAAGVLRTRPMPPGELGLVETPTAD